MVTLQIDSSQEAAMNENETIYESRMVTNYWFIQMIHI